MWHTQEYKAIGAGFVNGLDLGNNSKAAIMRIGLVEMRWLAHQCFTSVKSDTKFENAGLADLITTCFGGRNRECAGGVSHQHSRAKCELFLQRRGLEDQFPLFTTMNRICRGELPPEHIVGFAKRP